VFVCPRGHSYDVARAGYVNLLQPQDRRSRSAGDAKAAIDARVRLLGANVGRTILDAFVQRAATLDLGDRPRVVELGAGSGDALAALALARPIAGVGIDLSTAAAEHAARRFPNVTWAVANADRRLPLLDGSVELVLSMHARRNPAECARVLVRTGFLLVSVPAREDLLELRALVQGRALERDRAAALLAEHEPFFTLLERSSVRERHRLGREALLDLLKGTYRGERLSAADRVGALDSLEVTLASEIFLFAPRPALTSASQQPGP
jgi:23S rRNA (guanine745-N1)-methyltransferase